MERKKRKIKLDVVALWYNLDSVTVIYIASVCIYKPQIKKKVHAWL